MHVSVSGDVWYGFVASQPHLVYYFSNSETKKPDGEYLASVRKRFGQWILIPTSTKGISNRIEFVYIGRDFCPVLLFHPVTSLLDMD